MTRILVKEYSCLSKYQKYVRVRIHTQKQHKDTIEIWTLKFGLNGVFIIKSSIYAAFRGRIFFLSVGLKTENRKFYNPKI